MASLGPEPLVDVGGVVSDVASDAQVPRAEALVPPVGQRRRGDAELLGHVDGRQQRFATFDALHTGQGRAAPRISRPNRYPVSARGPDAAARPSAIGCPG